MRQEDKAPAHQVVRMSPEERVALNKCVDDNSMQRSVPFALVGAGGKYTYDVYVKGRRPGKWGMIGLAILGASLGRASCFSKCITTVAKQYPDGSIARTLTQSHNRQPSLADDMPTPYPSGRESYGSTEQSRSDSPPSILDMDMQRPDLKGLEESTIYEEENVQTPALNSTYEDMRRKNRESFRQMRTQQSRGPPLPSTMPPQVDQPLPHAEEDFSSDNLPPRKTKRRNQYGDEWEE